MKVDGSQQKTAGIIANYIRHYMRYYGVKIFVDPFCGMGHIYYALYKNKKLIDPETTYHLSDFNPFIIAMLEKVWSGDDIPVECDREEWRVISTELKRRFRNQENIFTPYDGFENWKVGFELILGTLHQNVVKGYIGDDQFTRNINEFISGARSVMPPNKLQCCDFIDSTPLITTTQKLIYCDFPEYTAKNTFPFGLYFDRDEFFECANIWSANDNIVIFSSKYFPDNGRYEIIYESRGQKLYIEKRWYVEDILDAASGYFQTKVRRARRTSSTERKRKRRKISRTG